MKGALRAELVLPLAALLTAAAAPSGGFSTAQPMPDFSLSARPRPSNTPGPSGYTEAPRPNQDLSAPHTRASTDASVAPGFFSRRDQYRGEGYSPNSSAQIEEYGKAKPGAGINLLMPLQ